MRGRWAAGIVPRNFCWIVKDHLAVSERPGGYAPNHRKVRRHEELLWLRAQGFTRVVSLLASTHNLHAYDELHLEWSRFAMPAASDTRDVLAELYPALHGWLRNNERVLLHQEELGDCVMGVVAGYLLWSEILPDGPRAITAMEQLLRRQMGTAGRMIVSVVEEVPSLESLAALEVAAAEQDGKTAPPQGAGAERTSDSDAGADNEAASPGARGPEEEAPLSLPSEEARGTEQEFAATAEDPGGDEGEPLGDEQDDDPACDPS
ncbi:MAG: hypothetical protein ABSA14_00585 [Acidimicrobiales bacterium]|jgi:CRP-like cAMP-binding protein